MNLNIFQAVEIILSNVKSIGGFPMINDILIEELLFKTCMLKPVDKEKDPLTVKLYDIDSMDNLNDIVLNTFFKKISPILNSLESVSINIFCIIFSVSKN